MVKLKPNPRLRAFIGAWQGPHKHRARFAASVGLMSACLLVGLGAAGWGKTFLGIFPVQTPAAVAPAPLTAEQEELLAITRAPAQAQPTDIEQARLINAKLPFSTAPVRPARPFNLVPVGTTDRQLAIECLTQAIYYEAGFEPLDGRRAVAQVVLNRLRHPAFPKTVCGVIYEGAAGATTGCQFSFACDGALRRPPAAGAWREARQIAEAALNGYVMAAVGEATHYHTDYVAPYWAPRLTKVKQIATHIFYRWPGGWGEPGAFNGRYAGFERAFTPGKPADAAPVLTVAEALIAPPKPADPTDRHAEADVGGRIDVEKGWTLTIPLPTETKSSLSGVADSQGG
jgi:spore germination cell wall hydrolase CwlJ-like protein